MLDTNLYRNNPEIIRESQLRRFASVEVVDEIILLDQVWRKRKYEYDRVRTEFNKLNKAVAKLKISDVDATEQIQQVEIIKQESTKCEAIVREAYASLEAKLKTLGNLVHDSVPISNDEEHNLLINVSGERRFASPGEELKHHVDLVELLDIVDAKRGAKISGGRGFVLKGFGVLLNQALINYSLTTLTKKGFTPIQPNCLMMKEVMAKCAQLSQFDEALYKVTGDGDDDKYLIATSEQPLCACHQDEWIHRTELPIRYAGYSTCFRKEASSHGRDTLGIFRVHQFEKVEQFCITGPDDSWEMLDEMLKNSEEFYQSLKIPYRVVSVVSGALNDAAAKKYDLEGWFPSSGTYRELVSCSNCTEYQSRRLNIRYGYKKSNEETKQYVHMLNSTLCATERTICCILENYQREDGVDVPEVLQPFMGGVTFLPFKTKAAKLCKTKGKQI
ncbi:hypothetical protein CARUB_v10012172mg [Capsella rubella]|uniref:serine--tRNA ligase n=1 Tax=Capsella rubella TaxID=81985 RepID=R0IPT7_9BRAS|nr:serine--tRNA ligase, cytoplasmic [Capsella rubella]EOA39203.1 hypothetical protein CARUB_v10012172mg [Capsella rubella]